MGVFVSNAGTSVTLTDVVVRDTESQESDGRFGRGLGVQENATADVTRALFERNRETGIFVSEVGTSVTLADLVVRDAQSRENEGRNGRGLSVQSGAIADVTRALFERNRETGIFVSEVGTSVTLADLVVRDTRGRDRDGRRGRGLNVQAGATADVTRALLAHNHQFGVFAANEGTIAQLTDIVVEETREQPCATATCLERSYGVGLGSVFAGAIRATRFAVTDSALCGVFLGDGGTLDLSEGQVSGSPIGVCLQVEDYAVARLTEAVRYFGNETNLDATTLPLPEVSESTAPTL